MKKLMKKVLTLALALTVLVSIVPPMTAEAAVSAPEAVQLYRSIKGEGTSFTSFYVGGLKKSTKIYPKTLKSSDKTVVRPWYFEKSSSNYGYTSYYYDENGSLTNADDPSESSSNYYNAYVGLRLLDAGKATVQYKIGSTTYKTKVTALAYTNPLKTVKITGVNSGNNIASKVKNQSTANVTLNSTKKNATVQIAAKTNWVITSVEVYDSVSGTTYEISNYGEEGTGSVKLNVGTLTKKEYASLRIYLYNTKTGSSMSCYYYIND